MLRVKVEQVREGQHPSEVVVSVTTADGGREELIVDRRSLHDGTLEVGYPVGRDRDRVLVELPRETLRGVWRVWVSATSLVGDAAA
jgi:hypothetical protein